MTTIDLMQTWIPTTMIIVLLVVIVLDTVWQARTADRSTVGGGTGAKSEAEARWHDANRAAATERTWHEKNRKVLNNR